MGQKGTWVKLLIHRGSLGQDSSYTHVHLNHKLTGGVWLSEDGAEVNLLFSTAKAPSASEVHRNGLTEEVSAVRGAAMWL